MRTLLRAAVAGAVALTVTLGVAVAACGKSASAPTTHGKPDATAAIVPVFPPTEADLMKHVNALADVGLRGRLAGTDDERRAAAYVVAEFERLGLTPAGDDGGWLQRFRYVHSDGVERESQNVVAWLPAADPADASWSIVGAHVDHLGVDAAGAMYRGADDNASGVAAMLGVAAAWVGRAAAGSGQPRHAILFVAFGAEEQWLKGSTWLATHPQRPIAELDVMINLDMVGRSPFLDTKDYRLAKALADVANAPGVGVLDLPGHPEFLAAARAACAADSFRLYAAEDFPRLESAIRAEAEDRGDQKPFKDLGRPYLFFSTSMNDDYHWPTDTPDKIDATTLRRVAQAVYRTTVTVDGRR